MLTAPAEQTEESKLAEIRKFIVTPTGMEIVKGDTGYWHIQRAYRWRASMYELGERANDYGSTAEIVERDIWQATAESRLGFYDFIVRHAAQP